MSEETAMDRRNTGHLLLICRNLGHQGEPCANPDVASATVEQDVAEGGEMSAVRVHFPGIAGFNMVFGRSQAEVPRVILAFVFQTNRPVSSLPSVVRIASARRCPLRKLAELAGFTLVELLVVIAVLAVLLAAVLPIIARARVASDRVREIASARMLAGAWQQYAQDAGGALLPGYKSGLPAFDANHEPIAAQTIGVAASRWVWRLAPYIGHDIRSIFVGDHERMLRERGQRSIELPLPNQRVS